MQAILEASMKRNDLNIIFCHADVKGAYMNDGMKYLLHFNVFISINTYIYFLKLKAYFYWVNGVE